MCVILISYVRCISGSLLLPWNAECDENIPINVVIKLYKVYLRLLMHFKSNALVPDIDFNLLLFLLFIWEYIYEKYLN